MTQGTVVCKQVNRVPRYKQDVVDEHPIKRREKKEKKKPAFKLNSFEEYPSITTVVERETRY